MKLMTKTKASPLFSVSLALESTLKVSLVVSEDEREVEDKGEDDGEAEIDFKGEAETEKGTVAEAKGEYADAREKYHGKSACAMRATCAGSCT